MAWNEYDPHRIYTGVIHWNGNVTSCGDVDFWIKHKGIDPNGFDSLDDLILLMSGKTDKYIKSFVNKVKFGKQTINPDEVYRLITQEAHNQKYSNVRGILSELISRKRIAKNLEGLGTLVEVSIDSPKITLNNKVTYELDANRQIDMVVSCYDDTDFSRFLDNLGL